MTVRVVREEATAESLPCLLLDLFGNTLLHTTTAATCFAWSLVSLAYLAIEHDLRSLRLHVVPGCPSVQHASPNHDVIQDSNRLFLCFPVRNS